MMNRIQVSIDAELLEEVDELRRKLKYNPSRSQVISSALKAEIREIKRTISKNGEA